MESYIDGNMIYWNLTEIILQDGESFYIEFDAEVIDEGTNINVVNLTANECSGEIWQAEDTAIVYIPPGEPEPLLQKTVWNQTSQQWEENVTGEIGEKIRFSSDELNGLVWF